MKQRQAPKGLVLAAASSNSGKTMLSLGLQRLLLREGMALAPAKCGPDYIDPAFHKAASHSVSINLDPWAMTADDIRARACEHVANADILFCEGVMGLFDGAAGGQGSSANLAKILALPVVLVLDVKGQAQTAAALVHGLQSYDPDVNVAGIILNRVGSMHHESLLREAIESLAIPILGAVRNNADLEMPSRHLGLVQANEYADLDRRIDAIADHIAPNVDLKVLCEIAGGIGQQKTEQEGPISQKAQQIPEGIGASYTRLPPLGRHIAIAKDAAFTFIYPHIVRDWQSEGAEISYFSPLADEAPHPHCDAIYLPGGYPELHLDALANAKVFKQAMRRAAEQKKCIFGECGGFMVLGKKIIAKNGKVENMLKLLPITTNFSNPKLNLGYRKITHQSDLPWPKDLLAHEFHYATIDWQGEASPLFEASNATGCALPAMGLQVGSVMGSFAHIIGPAHP
ncbi:MAG: cobyrinate a,c-diamide synthase [Cohaesibacter sp.]|nr:cobyrinate a,c-diamide synthase [Cohaesibacter sp.]